MRNSFFRSRMLTQDKGGLSISVEILDSVMKRITENVTKSSIEDGGKLLGTIREDGRELLIRVDSYIDSGPRVSRSATHLHPDGDYQEAVFRVVEILDPTIEHLGSWHSHHCNGLERLSDGDIRGYLKTVNKAEYNLDYFFAILITGLNRNRIEVRYYLFRRGKEEWFELDEAQITILKAASPLDILLIAGERASLKYREQSRHFDSSLKRRSEGEQQDSKQERQSISDSDLFKQWRAEDHEWIKRDYPAAKTILSKKTGAVSWQWSVERKGCSTVDFKYEHPGVLGEVLTHARLEARRNGSIVLSEEVTLNESRFLQIEKYIDRVLSS
jgi:hypothetical protein